MRFPTPLLQGRLIRRYKRFLADVLLDGVEVTVHVPNSGSMLGLDIPGSAVWLSRSGNPKRKLAYTLELVEAAAPWGEGLVGVNTGHPNALVAAAIAAGTIPELAGYDRLRREVKYGRNSRIDVLLEDDPAKPAARPPAYVEVKNVHLRRPGGPQGDHGDGAAEFPDCVTARGAKHLEEMAAMVAQGCRAVMLYLVQRGDCSHFRTAADLDPVYHAGLRRALDLGVEALCWSCAITPESIELDRPLPIRL
ncbi:DNA/RNA nuclease SfsA [Azospirillum sp. YIM B02556]|uniref:Sugar fermentation stimulation protein homolog n=1 Tax=Azospirillum endophyticum TaxID=2800326 RepID=A0ABS1EYS7_9PROT|nr:DNA/RNA nuclease SfsA [Azospirillum endophyticum]MBK1836324.1 DNA/RNA nuclease SfsA [Azospirillum endophyticum]